MYVTNIDAVINTNMTINTRIPSPVMENPSGNEYAKYVGDIVGSHV